MEGVLGRSLGASHRFAVDGHHPLGNPDQGRHPGYEAALERLGVEDGEDVAQMVMGRRARREGAKTARQVELLLAETGDVGHRLGPGQHRQKAQKQHLGQRVHHLSALPDVRQILEIAQKDNCLGERPAVNRQLADRYRPLANQRTSTDSALQPVVTQFLYPIALGKRRARLYKRRCRRRLRFQRFVRAISDLACGTRSQSSVQDKREGRTDQAPSRFCTEGYAVPPARRPAGGHPLDVSPKSSQIRANGNMLGDSRRFQPIDEGSKRRPRPRSPPRRSAPASSIGRLRSGRCHGRSRRSRIGGSARIAPAAHNARLRRCGA